MRFLPFNLSSQPMVEFLYLRIKKVKKKKKKALNDETSTWHVVMATDLVLSSQPVVEFPFLYEEKKKK